MPLFFSKKREGRKKNALIQKALSIWDSRKYSKGNLFKCTSKRILLVFYCGFECSFLIILLSKKQQKNKSVYKYENHATYTQQEKQTILIFRFLQEVNAYLAFLHAYVTVTTVMEFFVM